MDRPVLEKLLIALIFPKLSLRNMCGFGHTMILIPSFLTKSLLGLPGTMIPVLGTKYEEKKACRL